MTRGGGGVADLALVASESCWRDTWRRLSSAPFLGRCCCAGASGQSSGTACAWSPEWTDRSDSLRQMYHARCTSPPYRVTSHTGPIYYYFSSAHLSRHEAECSSWLSTRQLTASLIPFETPTGKRQAQHLVQLFDTLGEKKKHKDRTKPWGVLYWVPLLSSVEKLNLRQYSIHMSRGEKKGEAKLKGDVNRSSTADKEPKEA